MRNTLLGVWCADERCVSITPELFSICLAHCLFYKTNIFNNLPIFKNKCMIMFFYRIRIEITKKPFFTHYCVKWSLDYLVHLHQRPPAHGSDTPQDYLTCGPGKSNVKSPGVTRNIPHKLFCSHTALLAPHATQLFIGFVLLFFIWQHFCVLCKSICTKSSAHRL